MILWWEMSQVAFSWAKHRCFSNTCSIKYQWLFLLMGFFSFWCICDSLCLAPHSCTPSSRQWHSGTCFVFDHTTCELCRPWKNNRVFGRTFWTPVAARSAIASAELGVISGFNKSASLLHPFPPILIRNYCRSTSSRLWQTSFSHCMLLVTETLVPICEWGPSITYSETCRFIRWFSLTDPSLPLWEKTTKGTPWNRAINSVWLSQTQGWSSQWALVRQEQPATLLLPGCLCGTSRRVWQPPLSRTSFQHTLVLSFSVLLIP